MNNIPNKFDPCATRKLPAIYKRLAGIESTLNGTYGAAKQYINTGITVTQDMRLETRYILTGKQKWLYMAVSRNDTNDSRFGFYLTNRDNRLGIYAMSNSITYLPVYAQDVTLDINIAKKKATVNGAQYDLPAPTVQELPSFPIFCANRQPNYGFIDGDNFVCCYLRLTKNGVPVADYIPVQRIADGVNGMFDLVSETFKTNAYSTSLAYNFAPRV